MMEQDSNTPAQLGRLGILDQLNKEGSETKEPPKRELSEVIKGSNDVLVSASTVFPFNLFPDTITVDRTKLTIRKRTFLRSAELVSMRIEDVLNITASVGPIFGSVRITSRVLNDKPYSVDHFWRDDALKVKRIAQGYIIALQKNIDCDDLSTEKLTQMLEELGRDDHC
jgi:hypothetical protein